MKHIRFLLMILLAATLAFTSCDDGGDGNDGGTNDIDVTFMSAEQTGGTSGTTESTGLTLTFDIDPTTLTADNITVTGATKGALTGTGTQRIISISDINVANSGMVTIEITSSTGYSITGSPMMVLVYRISLDNMTIGMDYRGGKVAYILQSGDPGYNANVPHGLIAETADQSTGIRWYNGSYSTTGATGTALGTGQANTTAIVTSQGAGSYAAQICDDHTNADTGTGVYSDWFLPSKDELNKLYLSKAAIGGFADDAYWSSSENNAQGAWAQDFDDGYQDGYYKGFTYRVRAVRTF